MVKEKDFLSEVTASIPWVSAALGSHVEWTKIPDSIAGPNSRFSAPKAYDGFFCYCGGHIAVEAKMTHGMSVSFSALNDQQESKLIATTAAGCRAFVLVNFRTQFSQLEQKRRGIDRCIMAFAVPVLQWVSARQIACKGSLPLSWFESNAIVIPKIAINGAIGWDVRPMLEITF
jgi:penicillin-binding protein-related factor A (putative recombinase)